VLRRSERSGRHVSRPPTYPYGSPSLLPGGRASDDMIRSGAEVLIVAGVFEPVGDGWREVRGEGRHFPAINEHSVDNVLS
jgi:hypothetical protein